MAANGAIGVGNRLPWRLPADLKRFKALTMGKPILMGRRTHESIGRPLPGRTNIVLTRDPDYTAPGCRVVHSLHQALEVVGGAPELMVIGGARVYEQAMPLAERLYLTRVRAEVAGDTHFPEYQAADWVELEREEHMADDANPHAFEFVVLERSVR